MNTTYRTHLGPRLDTPCVGVTVETPHGIVRFALIEGGAVAIANRLASTIVLDNEMADALTAIRYDAYFGFRSSGTTSGFAWTAERCIHGASVWMTEAEVRS